MPFRKSAKITVTNESDQPCDAFYYYIDWQKHPSLPEDTAYFHAMYRQEFPCVMGQNYLLADIEGRGHYVGTVQSVVNVSDGWYGEGDDFFFIDGENEPQPPRHRHRRLFLRRLGLLAASRRSLSTALRWPTGTAPAT